MRAFALLALVSFAAIHACSSFATTENRADAGSPDDGAAPLTDVAVALLSGAGYPAAVLADRPRGYWRMNVPSGPDVPNEIDGGHPMVLLGSGHRYAVPGALAADPAMAFDGIGSFALVPASDVAFVGEASFSVECWANVDFGADSGADLRTIWSRTVPSPGHQDGVLLYFQFAGSNTEVARGIGKDAAFANHGEDVSGVWKHLVVTFDSSNAKLALWIDDIAYGVQSGVDLSGVVDVPLRVARDAYNGFFPGGIDEVAIYDYVLTETQIQAHGIAAAR